MTSPVSDNGHNNETWSSTPQHHSAATNNSFGTAQLRADLVPSGETIADEDEATDIDEDRRHQDESEGDNLGSGDNIVEFPPEDTLGSGNNIPTFRLYECLTLRYWNVEETVG